MIRFFKIEVIFSKNYQKYFYTAISNDFIWKNDLDQKMTFFTSKLSQFQEKWYRFFQNGTLTKWFIFTLTRNSLCSKMKIFDRNSPIFHGNDSTLREVVWVFSKLNNFVIFNELIWKMPFLIKNDFIHKQIESISREVLWVFSKWNIFGQK